MSEAPLVSVVIPSYNRLHCLPRAIASVLAQSHPALELIIVDDGSTDGTHDWARTFACPIPFTFHPLERNMGAAAARNRGIELARGLTSRSWTATISGIRKRSRASWPPLRPRARNMAPPIPVSPA